MRCPTSRSASTGAAASVQPQLEPAVAEEGAGDRGDDRLRVRLPDAAPWHHDLPEAAVPALAGHLAALDDPEMVVAAVRALDRVVAIEREVELGDEVPRALGAVHVRALHAPVADQGLAHGRSR